MKTALVFTVGAVIGAAIGVNVIAITIIVMLALTGLAALTQPYPPTPPPTRHRW